MDPRLPMRHRCLRGLRWGTICCVIAMRVVGLFLYTVWVLDCFFREFHQDVLCSDNFSLYPKPHVVSSLWLIIVSLTSMFLLLYIRRLPIFPGFNRIIKQVLQMDYFYKISVLLLLVITYDLISIIAKVRVHKTILQLLFMVEHVTSFTLILTLNFVPRFATTGSRYNLVGVVYKATLVIYSIEYYTLSVLETITATYHVLSIPSCFNQSLKSRYNSTVIPTHASKTVDTAPCHDAKSVTMLLLQFTIIYFRQVAGNFFLTKLFRENSDVLHKPLNPIASLSEGVEMLDIPEGISNDEKRPDV